MSPGATKDGIVLSATDAYFISTSAVCVTGLVPLNVHEHFTNYGQTILLVLFQVGAFGIMTFTYFVSLMVGQGLSLRSKVTISNLLDEEGIAVRGGLHCAPGVHRCLGTLEGGAVRVSPGLMNTAADARALIEAVAKIAG